jgi:predicted Rdx family selenoprotein
VFKVTLNGEVVFDKSELGRYPALPDSKEMKARVINMIEAVTV